MSFSDHLRLSVDEVVSDDDVAMSGVVMTVVVVRDDRSIAELEDCSVDGRFAEVTVANASYLDTDKAETFAAGRDWDYGDFAAAGVVQSKE